MVVAGVVLAGILSAIVMSTLKRIRNMDAGMATDIRPKENQDRGLSCTGM